MSTRFWLLYKNIEKGTKVSLDEFSENKELNYEVRNSSLSLYRDVITEASRIVNESEDSKIIWELLRRNIISVSLAQELIDISKIIANIFSIDDAVIYSMLVRIMEDLEELYFSIQKYLSSNA
ncbi:hypothetical protein [Acidianus brierleyi]|uniref:DUF86 domain-containing protein n=1 Tax=Acidianus brierleyi TaxID=41673 RepID=A0A2U9IBT8_9CREN|nr:hypothetical protein [Acidianus brierleyi]AWR93470.1 hypothetical protein DFR85_01440 [Acidianus brierleyi]